MRKLLKSGVVALAVCSVIGWNVTAVAEDKKPAAGHAADKQPAGQPPMTDEQKAMMEAYMKAATPGPEHAKMAAMVGEWDAEVKSMMDPSAPPEMSKSTVKREMLLDGRFIQSKWTGDMGGMPFQGLEIMGYDNAEGVYWSFWVDNMGTGSMMSKGKAEGNVITMKGEAFDPMMKSLITYTSKITHTAPDQVKFEMFRPAPGGGAEMKCLEITCTRKKAA